MPTFIKSGLWEKRTLPGQGYKGELNLENLINSTVGNSTYSREVLSFPVPAVGSTVSITPSAIDTIVVFEGLLNDNFTINVNVTNSLPGNRMYIFLEGDCTVTFSGDIVVTKCGGSYNTFNVGNAVCLEEIFNGSKFIGIDIC